MKKRLPGALALAVFFGFGWSQSHGQQFPNAWTTVFTDGGAGIEGLTGDDNGKLYLADRLANTCRVWEIKLKMAGSSVKQVGAVNAAGCRPSGITFGPDGALYITSPSQIYRLEPHPSVPSATLYAENVPGANGVAFLGNDLFVSDGTQNQGRIWKIEPCESPPCAAVEFLRIQPRRNSEDLGGNVIAEDQLDGVGTVRYTVPRHDTGSPGVTDRQDIVANGIAFSADGTKMFVADTARGAIWAADLDEDGNLTSQQGCDETFHENVLCMDSLYIAHPLLEGADGIALLQDGTILVSANERNAIVAVAPDKMVTDAFQNPADPMTMLRNGDHTANPPRPLETPTSPFITGTTFCTTNGEFPRRDNNPPGPGEGRKVNCLLDFELASPGLPLPVQ